MNHPAMRAVLLAMQTYALRLAAAAALLTLASPPAFAQTNTLVDIRNLRPRELQSTVFSLPSPQDVHVQAIGAEPENTRGTFSWISTMWTGTSDERQRDPWIGNAWILDLTSRRVVWELSASTTDRGPRGTRAFDGTVRLPAGTYAAFYSSFSNMYWTDDQGKQGTRQRFINWFMDQGLDEFKLGIQANGRVLSGADAERARHAWENGALVAFRGDGPEKYLQQGFVLDQPTQLEWSVEGEAREDAEFDTGWIIDANTHKKIWKMTWHDSAAAGGALKNRMAHVTRTLPPGRYAVFYATDDSHDAHEWNSPPPHDPDAWGLFLRATNGSSASIRPFTYEHVPAASTIVALTGIGNSESRSRGFTLSRPMDVRIYALGEGRQDRMVDYGWITSASTREKVWEMRYDETEHAGGDAKNRLIDQTIHLDKGNYILHYVSDDTHSAAGWNAAAPPDGKHWGITVLAASGTLDRGAVSDYVEKADPSVIAQLVRIRDDESPRKAFSLDHETPVRIYALGEASGRELADYGWIENTKTGRTVWEMTYRTSEPAGGASKNRKFDGTITLPAGEYVLRYETDGSHAFGSWNAAPPDDPEMWGITLYRVR